MKRKIDPRDVWWIMMGTIAIILILGGIAMSREVVKGICDKSRGLYDTYTKEAMDRMLAEKVNSGNFVVISGSANIICEANGGSYVPKATIEKAYPEGFNKDNSVVMCIGLKRAEDKGFSYGGTFDDSMGLFNGRLRHFCQLADKIVFNIYGITGQSEDLKIDYKMVIMKTDF